jgi:hypothetical protein
VARCIEDEVAEVAEVASSSDAVTARCSRSATLRHHYAVFTIGKKIVYFRSRKSQRIHDCALRRAQTCDANCLKTSALFGAEIACEFNIANFNM